MYGGNLIMKAKKNMIAGLSLLIFILLFTACGSISNSDDSTNKVENTKAEKRIVNTVKGDIEVPAEPKRVIGLSVVYPEFLYTLGVTPVAVQNFHEEYPAYLKEPFKDTLKLGISKTPNFEAILSASPDLIIAPAWWADKDYDQLSKIAPTVLLPEREQWTDELMDIAKVLNLEEKANQVMKNYKQKVLNAKQKLNDRLGNETVMYIRIMPKELIVYGENQSRGILIYKELGLESVPAFPESEISVALSMEKLPEYNPDHIILQLDNVDDKEIQKQYQELQESPLWKNLKAVKNGQVYNTGSIEWFNVGMSPLANSNAIDELLNAMLKEK
jgi:iron complex transport system substrate-binding protein